MAAVASSKTRWSPRDKEGVAFEMAVGSDIGAN